jgi:hypothetical protein
MAVEIIFQSDFFSNIPNELLELILTKLGTCDLLLRCALVCRRFNTMIASPAFWTWKLVGDFGHDAASRFLRLTPNDATTRQVASFYKALGRNLARDGMTYTDYHARRSKGVFIPAGHQCSESACLSFEKALLASGVQPQSWVDPPICKCNFEHCDVPDDEITGWYVFAHLLLYNLTFRHLQVRN